MEVISTLVEIPNNQNPTTEYILSELALRNIEPLRWAVVDVNNTQYTISVAMLKNQEG